FPYLSSVGRYVCCFSLHDALPIYRGKILSRPERLSFHRGGDFSEIWLGSFLGACSRHGRTLSQARKRNGADFSRRWPRLAATFPDRKSTRLNSSHRTISYAVFCLK